MPIKQKINTFLWFDSNAEDAVDFYISIFNNSRIVNVARYGDTGPGPKGGVMSMTFELEGQRFMCVNGGPHFKFTPAISLLVECESQEEIDRLWTCLLEGGEAQQCGWLTDRFGLSWQITPTVLFDYLQDKDPERSNRVMQAMMGMVKFDIDGLKRAYEGR